MWVYVCNRQCGGSHSVSAQGKEQLYWRRLRLKQTAKHPQRFAEFILLFLKIIIQLSTYLIWYPLHRPSTSVQVQCLENHPENNLNKSILFLNMINGGFVIAILNITHHCSGNKNNIQIMMFKIFMKLITFKNQTNT